MLSILIGLPVLGALLLGFWPTQHIRLLALGFSSALLVGMVGLMSQFRLDRAGMQFVEHLPWIEPIGLAYHLGVDGLSLPLLALNAFLTWIAIYSSPTTIERPRLYFALLLLGNAGIAGALLAQNLLLFVLFYEVELIPFYLLIAIWGGTEKRGYAAMKFLLYTAISGFLVLGAFLGIALLGSTPTFAYDPAVTQGFSLTVQLVLLTMLLVGFGIKIPLVPLHTWLPDAYVEASAPVAILLGGVLAKLGTYGLVRFGLGLFPETWHVTAPGLALMGAACAAYGALSAIAQRDIKRMVAYSSIGHMGYILLAVAAATPLSLLGAVLSMISHGLILAVLFHLIGVVETKVGTRDLDLLNGLMNPVRGLPLVSALLILGGMASAGIPGLVGFIAEFLVLQGSFEVFPIPTLLCVLCSGLTAVYFVILLNRTCFGRLNNAHAYYPSVRWVERTPALILTAFIVLFGIQPSWLTRWSEPMTQALSAEINPTVALLGPSK
ncbi:NADH-quinone oxidoreductase subunit M [Anthocerotibacter panamensis]|uniref:NADH-quinone oxidoreductase subunit M n=1 Tax=Anthocerotibacter panamensis TaxID=2857077 RepID=UPI001C40812D|nr:NADH-quinone oxidoreductase subunit M [Anthocerotibacter panamensis]